MGTGQLIIFVHGVGLDRFMWCPVINELKQEFTCVTFDLLGHGKAPDIRIQKQQNFIDPLLGKIAGGCHTGRDIPFLFKEAGLKFEFLEEMYIPGPKVLSYNYWGAAFA